MSILDQSASVIDRSVIVMSEGSRNATTAGYSGKIGTLAINVMMVSQREESGHTVRT